METFSTPSGAQPSSDPWRLRCYARKLARMCLRRAPRIFVGRLAWVPYVLRSPFASQSLGGTAMPQTFPGSVRHKPSNHVLSCSPREIQFTTVAVTLFRVGKPSTLTHVRTATGTRTRPAQPCGLTSTITHGMENSRPHSVHMRVIGISQGILVPDRVVFPCAGG